jgi:hypothetical protein
LCLPFHHPGIEGMCTSRKVQSSDPAFWTAGSNTVRKLWHSLPCGVCKTTPPATVSILTAFNVAVNTSFIGILDVAVLESRCIGHTSVNRQLLWHPNDAHVAD